MSSNNKTYTKEQIKSEYLKGKSKRYSETKNKEIYNFIENEWLFKKKKWY